MGNFFGNYRVCQVHVYHYMHIERYSLFLPVLYSVIFLKYQELSCTCIIIILNVIILIITIVVIAAVL